MDTGKWTQEIVGVVKSPMAEIAQSTCSSRPVAERKVRPQKDQALTCPRCHSTNTKFCYYNNYSLTQPRYFCKTCRRYWTEGGTLRNVPVGGGSRKNKRSSTSTTATIPTVLAAAPTQKFPDLNPPSISEFASQNPKTHQSHDLNLAFPGLQGFHGVPQFLELGKIENGQRDHQQLINSSSPSSSSMPSSTSFSTLELLKTGIASRELNNSFVSNMPVSDLNALYASGYTPLFQEMKPSSLHFSHVEGVNGSSRYDHQAGPNGVVQENVGKVMFPFGGMLKQNSSTNEVDDDQSKGQGNSTGYWNGMLGGGSW